MTTTPSSRLYVDVDDTLISHIDYDISEPNLDVIRFIRLWRQINPEGELIVWSTGGQDYAEEAAALCGLAPCTCRSKEPVPYTDTDLFIDDEPLVELLGANNIHPFDLD